MRLDSIIFDLDGTLWDSTKSVLEAWNRTLSTFDEVKNRISIEEMESVMGLIIEDIALKFFPYLDEHKRLEVVKQCCKEECKHLMKSGAILYDYLEETLKTLSKDYKLLIVSNCQEGYIETFLKYHQLEKYFMDYESFGHTGLPKGENIKLIMARNKLKNAIYVGDTAGDSKASQLAGIPFVYASYGFGQVDRYDYKIDYFNELLGVVEFLNE